MNGGCRVKWRWTKVSSGKTNDLVVGKCWLCTFGTFRFTYLLRPFVMFRLLDTRAMSLVGLLRLRSHRLCSSHNRRNNEKRTNGLKMLGCHAEGYALACRFDFDFGFGALKHVSIIPF
jgi:hypothetical protein